MHSIKKLLNHINEATLEQTLSNFDMNKFVNYYIQEITKEYNGLPDQLLDYVLETLEESSEYGNDFQQEMGIPYSEFDANDDEELQRLYKSKVFKEIIKGYLDNALEHTLPELKRYASQKQVTIYRVLRFHPQNQSFIKTPIVSPEETYVDYLAKYGKRLGIYWTADKEVTGVLASSITGEDEFDESYYLFEVNIDSRYINWYDTLYQRTHVEYGDWQEWKSEKEIRLYKNTPVKLMSLGRYNPDSDDFEPVDISKIKGKTFYA